MNYATYVVFFALVFVAAQEEDIVAVRHGLIAGSAYPSHREFLGVPYAAPPVGNLRFMPPVDPDHWEDVLPTQKFRLPCPQQGTEYSEDCLYLNIWAPPRNATVPPDGFPVQVFWHGGAFRSGNPNVLREYGDLIVGYRQDFIMVTSCDRLGAVGYACFNGIKEATPDGSAGNFGIQDGRHVLKWIRENIAAFNGNPNLVTITGHSGGSMKVANHLTNGRSFGLYQHAGMESGAMGTRAGNPFEASEKQTYELASNLGCFGTDRQILDCLRAVDIDDIIAVQFQITGEWQPCTDGVERAAVPSTIASANLYNKVPIMVGSVYHDGYGDCSVLGPEEVDSLQKYKDYLLYRFRELAPEVEELYPYDNYPSGYYAAVAIQSELYNTCQGRRTARWVSNAGNPVYYWDFAIETSTEGFVTHGSQIPCRFFRVDLDPLSPNTPRDTYIQRCREMTDYWVSFTQTGNPNFEGRPVNWTPYTQDNASCFTFDPDGPYEQRNFRHNLCDYWDNHLDFDGRAPCEWHGPCMYNQDGGVCCH